jgi:hypothetical protein
MISALVAPLLQQGLSLLSNAVLAKGKDWVEQKTGVKLDDPMTPEQIARLKQAEMEHEEELMRIKLEENKLDIELMKIVAETDKTVSVAVTEQWKSDMSSDSWLAKNIRPIALIYILSAYTIMAFSGGVGFIIPAAYVELLGQWGMLIMSAYFGGRSLEKIMETRSRKNGSS